MANKKYSGLKATCHPERVDYHSGLCQACYTDKHYKRATCHPDRASIARGLCKRCYEQAKRTNVLDGVRRADCHPDRPHWAKGMCGACYNAWSQKTNPEGLIKRQRRYRERHPERRKEITQRFNLAHPEKSGQYTKKWRDANREKVKETRRKYVARNREKYRARDNRRHARKRGTRGETTELDRRWRAILFGNACAYCGGEYKHMDHLVALNAGGGDYAGNLVPACVHCNESKRDLDWHTWYRSRDWFDPKRERFIERNTW